jgi:hypothetical protein
VATPSDAVGAFRGAGLFFIEVLQIGHSNRHAQFVKITTLAAQAFPIFAKWRLAA